MHCATFGVSLGIVLVAFGLRASAATLEGKVVAVADGDTLTLLDDSKTQHRIRLQGIDAPEKGQPYGQRAKENMSRLTFGKPARADCHKKDRYGRQVCIVWVQPPDCPACQLTLDIGYAQLTRGLAWHYKTYAREQTAADRATYADAEIEARKQRAGLWMDPKPVAPWDWRASGRTNRSIGNFSGP
ncbi:MAG: thermonuclease family protein [Betaproteobacteria bacterium]|nr:thermonuclease family protein [Betaproteobacteria bacterium]